MKITLEFDEGRFQEEIDHLEAGPLPTTLRAYRKLPNFNIQKPVYHIHKLLLTVELDRSEGEDLVVVCYQLYFDKLVPIPFPVIVRGEPMSGMEFSGVSLPLSTTVSIQ